MVSSTPRPHFTPGKDPVPIAQEAGWAPGPFWTGGKSRPHRGSCNDRFFLKYNRAPLIRALVIRIANYPNRLGPSGILVENSTKLNCLVITGYWIKYSTVLWLIELQTRRGWGV